MFSPQRRNKTVQPVISASKIAQQGVNLSSVDLSIPSLVFKAKSEHKRSVAVIVLSFFFFFWLGNPRGCTPVSWQYLKDPSDTTENSRMSVPGD